MSAAIATPLVMLPGTLCDARIYALVLAALDRPALIPQIGDAPSAAMLAEKLLAELPPRFALCGFSLGAIVALEIARQAPERVERLALIGCNPGTLSPSAATARAAQSHADFVAASAAKAGPELRATIAEMAAATAGSFADQTRITLSRADSRPHLGRLAMPSLVVCGSDDAICPPALSIAMAAALPYSRLALIAGAGHYVTLEQPRAVADELAAWLAMPAQPLH